MVSADMCRHDWPGSGCAKCKKERKDFAPEKVAEDRPSTLMRQRLIDSLSSWIDDIRQDLSEEGGPGLRYEDRKAKLIVEAWVDEGLL